MEVQEEGMEVKEEFVPIILFGPNARSKFKFLYYIGPKYKAQNSILPGPK